MIKKVINFIKQNFSSQDIGLIILAALAILMVLTNNVFAAEEEIGWSSTNRAITDEQFKNIIFSNMNLSVDVLNEDFNSYTSTISNFSYTKDILNGKLNNSNYTKAFMNYDNKLVLITEANKLQLHYDNYSNSALPKKYYFSNSSYIFDFDNKTIQSFNEQQQYPFYDLGWWLDGANVTQAEFETTAYKQNMIYNTFFLVLGPIYDNLNTTEILNYVKSFKIDGNLYENEQFTGEIVFSEEFVSWQTRDLSENFYNSGDTFTYYVHGLDYSEGGIATNSSFKVKITDIIFTGDSIYLPTINQVNNAIKQAEGYMNYAYVITLTLNDVLLLRSDVFIVDAKPITVIPYFRYKYDYIYYRSYIDIGSSSSGDTGGGVISPSGDDTNLEGGISGIWQAIVDLPQNLLEGLVGLFVPSSDYFFNDDPDDLGLWQRFSSFFQEKLGFLYDVLAFIPNLISIFIDIIQSFSEDWSIQIPDLTIPELTGVEQFTFLEGFEWSPYEWVNSREEFRNLYDLYLKIIDFFVYWGLIWYGIKTYNNVMGNVNYDVEGE